MSIIIISLQSLVLFTNCARERPSGRPPIHLNPDMDNQPKYKAQSENRFFEDGSAMRMPAAGTVARDNLRDDDKFFRGTDSRGNYIKKAPVVIDMQLLDRGQERFDIYCSPCHSRIGDGRGIMVNRGYVPPPTFHSDRIRQIPDGQIFDVITHGVRNMPSYAGQIPPADRWATVSYLRALQRSRNATRNDIPIELRETIK
jgi:mono/diheme cytochrome c family protein